MNSGVHVKGSCHDAYERDFYGMLTDIVELSYFGQNHIILFKCLWYDSEGGLRVHPRYGIVDIKYKSRLASNEPFVLAHQAHQVYYASYPAQTKELSDWWAIINIKSRSTYNVAEVDGEGDNDATVVDDLFQEDEMRIPVDAIVDLALNEQVTLRSIGEDTVNLDELSSSSRQSNNLVEEDEDQNLEEEEANKEEEEDEEEEDEDEEDEKEDEST